MEDCKRWDKYLMRGGHYQPVTCGVGSCFQREGMGFNVILVRSSLGLFPWISKGIKKALL